MLKKSKTIICLLLFTFLPFAFSQKILAGTATDLRTVYPLAGNDRTLGYYISPLIRNSILGAALISFIMILVAGFTLIAGAGNSKDQEKGKKIATAGVSGLALVFTAYWIVRIVEVLTGVSILNNTSL